MFVGVQVAVEGEGWMVRAIDNVFSFNFLRTRLLTEIREGSLSLILLCLLGLVILYLSPRDCPQTSAFNGSLTLHLSIIHILQGNHSSKPQVECVRDSPR